MTEVRWQLAQRQRPKFPRDNFLPRLVRQVAPLLGCYVADMATIAGYQILQNEDGTNTEVLLFESCCAHCGEAFLAAASVFSPVPDECPHCGGPSN